MSATNRSELLGDEVAKCDLLLAVIGPNWLNAKDEEDNRRLDNERDFVRIEIAAALNRDIPNSPAAAIMFVMKIALAER